MKKILFIDDNIENRISYYHLLLFLLTLPFDRFYSSVILVSLLIHTAVFLKKNALRAIGRQTVILQSVFFVTVVSALYAHSFSHGLDMAEKQLAVFLLPLIFSVMSFDPEKYYSRLMTGFSVCCTVTVLYLYVDAIRSIIYNKLPVKELFSEAFVSHNFSLPIEMHATYFSMLLALSFLFLLSRVFSLESFACKIFFAGCALILLAGLLQSGSKSVLLSLLVIVNTGFPFFVIAKKQRWRFFLISVTATALLITLILSVNVFHNRYVTLFRDDLYENTGIAEQHSRLDRWEVAVTLIKKSPWIGTGAASEVPLLREQYYQRKMYDSYLHSLNSHNQYLSFLINSGIFGLVLFLGTLAWGLWRAFRLRRIMLFSFIIITVIVSFSENLLDVNKGIFFYAFFFTFFTATQKTGQ